MRKKWILLAVAGAALAIATPSLAGRTIVEEVVIDTNARTASGSLGSAFHSSDTTQYIGCGITYNSGLTQNNVSCFASDTNGNVVQCTGNTLSQVLAVATMTKDSYVSFSWVPVTGQGTNLCTGISVQAVSPTAIK